MSGRLLDFKSYVGGADNVVVEEQFPNESNQYVYNYGTDVSTYTFTANHQTIIVDAVAYDRNTGLPNFTESKIIGFIGNGTPTTIDPSVYIDTSSAATGVVNFSIPPNLYTGGIIPSARVNVPLTIVTFTWSNPNGSLPSIVDSHRWCLMQRWDSSVSPADPVLESTYSPLGVGGVLTFTDNSATDTDRVVGAYSVTGLSSNEGTGATFSVQVTTGGVTNIDITSRGTGYTATDTIQLLDVDMGGGGAADILVTVASIS